MADARRLAYWLLKDVNRAIRECKMIADGDRVAVAVSGGKDSLSLLRLLDLRREACAERYELVVIHVVGRESELRRIYGQDWFTQAPLVICACGVPEENWVRRDGKNYNDVDVAIVMDHLTLAAADVGLGTCWIGAFDPDAAREVLGLPNGVEPVAFTPLGYPADSPRSKMRKALDELVRYERW